MMNFYVIGVPTLLILNGLLTTTSVMALPVGKPLMDNDSEYATGNNNNQSSSNELTATTSETMLTDTTALSEGPEEYPVFVSVTEEEAQSTPPTPLVDVGEKNPESVTENYMVIEEQEVDDEDINDESESATSSSPIIRTTEPMKSPKPSHEQEEVLRELKKLWDISEGLSDSGNFSSLKTSLSSIVHLAYARLYSESDSVLLQLRNLLKQLQVKLMGTETNGDSRSTAEASTEMPSSSSSSLEETSDLTRRKRSIYDAYSDEVEAIFFANVNSEENSVMADEKKYYYKLKLQHQNQSNENIVKNGIGIAGDADISHISHLKNDSVSNMSSISIKEPPDHSLFSVSTTTASSSTTVMSFSSPSTTPSSVVQKVIHINDRVKPMSPFYLSPERINELKSKMTSTTPKPPLMTLSSLSSLSPITINIDDELENEVNSLQQQQQVENYDVHIIPLSTTPSSLDIGFSSNGTKETSEFPHTPEEIALALFQLLRPDSDDDEESVSPTPSSILYQVDSLSSVLNFSIAKPNFTEITLPTHLNKTKANNSLSTEATTTLHTSPSPLVIVNTVITNESFLVPPSVFSDYVFSTASPSSESITTQKNTLEYTDFIEEISPDETSISTPTSTTILEDTKDGLTQMIKALGRLSTSAKIVLLFSIAISILSIGLGFAFGPPLTLIGVLGIVVPVALLLFLESTPGGKRKLTTRQQQKFLISKIQSDEFSKVLDLIFDATLKYSKGK